ncbi:MAG: porin [Hyphomicrobiales bacterium]|nr:porin [Hyphomicrobiales bacterium]
MAAGIIAAPAFSAERIAVHIEGELQQWGVLANQDVDTGDGTGVDTNRLDQKHNSELYFNGETILDNGLEIGLSVTLEANTDANQIDQSYLYVEHPHYGLLQMGDVDNAPVNMAITAPDGGVSANDGDLVGIEAFILPEGFEATNTLIDTTILQLGDDTSGKFNYYTPRVSGFQLGLSYVPQFEDGGDNNNSISRTGNDGPVNDGIAIGLSFSEEFGDLGVEAFGGYLFGDTPASEGSDNVNGAGAGLVLAVAGFEAGGSFAWADGDTPGGNSIDGHAFDVGVAYETGPYRVGLTYIKGITEGSRADSSDQRLDQVVISGTYALGPGVDLVGGLFYFDADGEKNQVAGTNGIESTDGFGALSGLKLTF